MDSITSEKTSKPFDTKNNVSKVSDAVNMFRKKMDWRNMKVWTSAVLLKLPTF